MQTQIELAGGLGYINEKLVQELMAHGEEVARLINGLVAALGRGKSGEEPNSQERPIVKLR